MKLFTLILCLLFSSQAIAAPATQPTIVVTMGDGSTWRGTLQQDPPPDPNLIRVAAGDDLAAAISRMSDGKTLALAAGGKWPVVINWRWSRATLTRYGDGDAPQIAGFKTAAPFTDTVIAGVTARGTTGYGFDLRGFRLQRCAFRDLTADGFQAGYTIHLPDLDNVPREQWHQDITFSRCRALNCQSDDPSDSFKGQGWYAADVDGLTIEDCHADNCGNLAAPSIFNHGYYLAWRNARVVVRRSIATRCASYCIQSRSDGALIEDCAAYDCGMGIMANGSSGTVRNSVVIRGHGHAAPQTYGKGGFDLHLGAGEIAGNLVLNGPQVMPTGWYQPPPFNVAYRETKRDAAGRVTNSPWEWTKLDLLTGKPRPLATAGAGNVDRSALIVSVDVAALLKMPPDQAAARLLAIARAAR